MQHGKRRVLISDPETDPYEGAMEFRLTYEGKLLSSGNNNTRPGHKHAIRMHFHSQLFRLWKFNRSLSAIAQCYAPSLAGAHEPFVLAQARPEPPMRGKYLDLLQSNYPMFNTRWAPLVIEGSGLTCSVDVLFLRRGARGGVMQSGDIDGRLKTLFDALAIPRSNAGLPHDMAATCPIYTLLDDDKNISHVSVTTDELLDPTEEAGAGNNDARVVLTVNVRPTHGSWFSLNLVGV